MKNEFKAYIEKESFCLPDDRILLAISGGIDSMVMLHLFINCKYKNIAVAHCNFSLRGKESDEDQLFIEDFCLKQNIKLFVKRFITQEYVKSNQLSIQVAARNLRYEWFDELLRSEGFNRLAIAHNKNDAVETFLINLSRGTGIKGLTGMKKSDSERCLIRPLLFADRDEI